MVLSLIAWPQLSICVPAARPSATVTVIVKVFVSPTAIVPASHSTVPSWSVHSPGSDATVSRVVSMGSLIVTSVASSGPWLVALSVYVMVPPAWAVAGPVFATSTSATGTGGSTYVLTQETVSPLSGSAVELVTVSQLRISVSAAASSLTRTVIVKVRVSSTASVPTSQVTLPSATWQPSDTAVTVTRDVSTGSVTITLPASAGPSLVTVSV